MQTLVDLELILTAYTWTSKSVSSMKIDILAAISYHRSPEEVLFLRRLRRLLRLLRILLYDFRVETEKSDGAVSGGIAPLTVA
jgi:hypothetical protein